MKLVEIIASLMSQLSPSDGYDADQGLVHGSMDMEVCRILVCQSPSVGALREAVKTPGTLLISREHPFYQHGGTYWSAGVEAAMRASNDPVLLGKQAVIDQGEIAIYRLQQGWDTAFPKAQGEALAERLGWQASESGGGRKVICDIAAIELDALALTVSSKLGAGHVRVTGTSGTPVKRVALLPEFVSLGEAREVLAFSPAVDGLICGETCEWEAGPYFKDTAEIGRMPLGVVYAGHQPTQAPGVLRMHEWIARHIQNVPVDYLDIDRPVRNLRDI